LKAAANAVEQPHAKLGFQRLDLARGRGLAQMQPPSGAGETAGVGDGDQGLQLPKVHPGPPQISCRNHMNRLTINALDKSSPPEL